MILAHGSLVAHGATVLFTSLAFVGYRWAWRRHPTPNVAPLVWMCLAMLTLIAASLPAVEAVAQRSFLGHMAQHLVLWAVVPPLLWAAHPIRTLRRARLWPRGAQVWSTSVLHRHGWRLALAWVLVVATMYGTHLTPLYEASLQHQWLHEAEHLAYLASSVLLWSTVLGPGRAVAPARAGLAVAAAVPLIVLGMVLSTADVALYATYVDRLGAADALADQRGGAALMWIGMMAASLVLIVWSVLRWADHEQQMQVMAERSLDARAAQRDRPSQRGPTEPIHTTDGDRVHV